MTRVLIIGGYGVFGGRLATRLIKEGVADILVGGRSRQKADAFCADHGGTPVVIDRDNPASLMRVLKQSMPDIVVDASGPFDMTGIKSAYRVAEAAIRCGAHYVDLADDADFVASFRCLDKLARRFGVTAISGASSVPAISSAAIDALAGPMQAVDAIETAILPGNRAPRGLAVIRSILGQAGQPFRVWRENGWRNTVCWGSIRQMTLRVPGKQPVRNRWASPIRVPDTELMARHFKASTVTFHAGLELPVLHGGLWLLAWLPRLGLVKSLRPLAPLVQAVANCFIRAGSDRGGMVVKVKGFGHDGRPLERRWTLIAEEGSGPFVPTIPAYLIVKQLIAGSVPVGARPALGAVKLAEVEAAMAPLAITCHSETVSDEVVAVQSLRTMTEPAE